MKKFPNYRQTEAKDCGPTCIKIIAKHYGKTINTQQLRSLSETTREGSSLLGLSDAVDDLSLKSRCFLVQHNPSQKVWKIYKKALPFEQNSLAKNRHIR